VTFDGLGEHLFEDDRKQLAEKGETHPVDKPAFADAEILFVNENFGCGSSREHAPQSIARWGKGIKAIVGESFAEIFFGNCQAMGIPCVTVSEKDMQTLMSINEANPDTVFTVNLELMRVSWPGGAVTVSLDEGTQKAFMEGRWDSTTELLEAGSEIEETAAKVPYFGGWE
jgi:3-isopropylmalate/(R)-2-methylmalate dehydratase small subunit